MSIDEIVVEATAIHVTMGDLEKNYHTMLAKILDSAANGVDLVVLPEMATCGYAVGDELEMERFLENNKKLVDKLIQDTKHLDIAVALGFVDYDKDKTGHDGKLRRYNAAVVFQKGKVKGVIHKNLLPTYTLFDEKRWFTPGNEFPIIEIDARGRRVKLGVGICEMKWAEDYVQMVEQDFQEYYADFKSKYSNQEWRMLKAAKSDFRYDEKMEYANPALAYKRQGAEMLVWLNASPFHAGKLSKIDAINKARVAETGLPLVDSNFVGIGDNVYDLFGFSGESGVMGSNAEYIAVTRPWKQESAIARINLKTGLGQRIKGEPKRNSTGKFLTDYVDQVIDGLVYMGGDFVRQTSCKTVIESMSGGVDSSIGTTIATLARDAGFFDNVYAYTFPTQFNTATTKSSAQQVADKLGVQLTVIPIQEEFVSRVINYARGVLVPEEFDKAEHEYFRHGVTALKDPLISEIFEKQGINGLRRELSASELNKVIKYATETGVSAFYCCFNNPVTPENMQARLRSEWMKLFSNEYNAVEWVNPNKDERRQGYTTLWGDMAGSLMIIGDLDKWLVRAVAKRLNERMGKEVIPKNIIDKVNPSAELSDAQNPEKGGGDPFDYVTLGIILDNYTFGRKDVPDIVDAFRKRELNLHYCPHDELVGKSIYDKLSVEEFEKYATEYITRNERMRFKGVVAPLCPKVTRRALGFELRTPVTSHYFRSAEKRKEVGLY